MSYTEPEGAVQEDKGLVKYQEEDLLKIVTVRLLMTLGIPTGGREE